MTTAAAIAPPPTPVIVMVNPADVRPSPHNPRTSFDDARLKDLAGTILRTGGLMQPLVLRENKKLGGLYELVAGDRRWRACKIAGLASVPAIVRVVADADLVELMLIENLQREALTELEEARGYRDLINTNPTRHNAESIAARIQKSPKYVWDRMKLLDLIPAGQKMLETGRISAAHAIIIARQSKELQKKLLDPPSAQDNRSSYTGRDGLWVHDGATSLLTDAEEKDAEKDPYYGWKTCSAKELEAFIAHHVRFNPEAAAKADPFLFAPVAAQVTEAAAKPGRGAKVIKITYEYHVHPDAKDGAERTFSVQSWRRADGQEGSKTCDKSKLGVVAVGPGYGTAFDVCVDRECDVHFAKEKREKAKRAKEAAGGGGGSKSMERARARDEAEERRHQEEREAEDRRRDVWQKNLLAIHEAVAEKVNDSPLSTVVAVLEQYYNAKTLQRAVQLVKAKGPEGTIRKLAMACLIARAGEWGAYRDFAKQNASMASGVHALLKGLEKPEPKPEAEKAAAAPKGKPAPRKAAKPRKAKKGGRAKKGR